jgi:hypothetical protein
MERRNLKPGPCVYSIFGLAAIVSLVSIRWLIFSGIAVGAIHFNLTDHFSGTQAVKSVMQFRTSG